jgi:hypothetical protein
MDIIVIIVIVCHIPKAKGKGDAGSRFRQSQLVVCEVVRRMVSPPHDTATGFLLDHLSDHFAREKIMRREIFPQKSQTRPMKLNKLLNNN